MKNKFKMQDSKFRINGFVSVILACPESFFVISRKPLGKDSRQAGMTTGEME